MIKITNNKGMFLPLWINTLVLLKQGQSAHKITYILGTSYSHIHILTKQFVKNGWVIKEKVGRINTYKFTKEGNKVVKACEKLINVSHKYMNKRGRSIK